MRTRNMRRPLTVRRHAQVPEKGVCQGLVNVRPVEFHGGEHNGHPDHDLEVYLANNFPLFSPRPSRQRVEPV